MHGRVKPARRPVIIEAAFSSPQVLALPPFHLLGGVWIHLQDLQALFATGLTEWWVEVLNTRSRMEDAAAAEDRAQRWKTWAQASTEQGGRLAHRYSRQTAQPQEDLHIGSVPVVGSSAVGLAARPWHELWNAASHPARNTVADFLSHFVVSWILTKQQKITLCVQGIFTNHS
eukprot:6192058-Amphidinium_carterae.2